MQTRVPIRGEMVDISEATITRILYGPNITPPKCKDESRYDLKLHKLTSEVFGSSGQTAREKETTIDPVGESTRAELVFHVAPIPTSTPSTLVAAAIKPGLQSAETLSTMPQSSQHAFTPANFARVVKKADKQEKQLKLFADQLVLFEPSQLL
ncbi:hypothetical protein HAX54_053030 [Datura stramonium]|uniref:Uncharacterized protein n=1 Tax=Datura stramonium TaxID=4076 RepID=A0ABS8WSX9_DATST|nr:hypothetical protein [Datura stramonium]